MLAVARAFAPSSSSINFGSIGRPETYWIELMRWSLLLRSESNSNQPNSLASKPSAALHRSLPVGSLQVRAPSRRPAGRCKGVQCNPVKSITFRCFGFAETAAAREQKPAGSRRQTALARSICRKFFSLLRARNATKTQSADDSNQSSLQQPSSDDESICSAQTGSALLAPEQSN